MKLVEDLGMLYPRDTSKSKKRYGLYECPLCMKHFKTMSSDVKSGQSTKCRSCASTKHGLKNHKLYNTWTAERQRCNNPKHKGFMWYGGRGIKMSEEFNSFAIWLEHVESLPDAYKETYTIDREDNDGNYERGNLKWSSPSEQSQNQRRLQANNTNGYRCVSINGKRFKSEISVSNERIHIGTFDTMLEAATAYDKYILDNNLNHTTNGLL